MIGRLVRRGRRTGWPSWRLGGDRRQHAPDRGRRIIAGADGHAIASSEELQRVLRGKKPGDTMRLTVFRDGKRTALSVTLGERPVG
jgi:S1-C subfamily serine protease